MEHTLGEELLPTYHPDNVPSKRILNGEQKRLHRRQYAVAYAKLAVYYAFLPIDDAGGLAIREEEKGHDWFRKLSEFEYLYCTENPEHRAVVDSAKELISNSATSNWRAI